MKKYSKHIKLYSCLVLTLAFIFMPLKALAYTNNHFYSSNDILFYDKDDKNCNTSLVGNDNLEKIMGFLVGKDLTIEQVAGIAGNLQRESNFDPTDVNPSSGAYGIAQWLHGRKDALQSKANYSDLSVQLDFMWEELNGDESNALSKLQSTSTPEEAALSFEKFYERSGDTASGIALRVKYANSIYEKYKNYNFSTGSGSGQCLGGSFSGEFTFYSQTDPEWAGNTYLNGTIGDIGCGITAMAMIITALTGQSVTPDQTATIMNEEGGLLEYVLPEHWGLNSEEISTTVADVNETLNSGGLVIAYGIGSSPFSQRGHYIVIRAVTSDGKWQIADPSNSGNNSKEFDPNNLIESGGSALKMWAITK